MKPAIELGNVSFRYSDRTPWVVRDLNLSTRPGEFFMLLGPSGCGKTTVLNLVAGFERATEGDVRVAGRPVSGQGADRAVIFQGDDSLYPWLTAAQNVEFPLRVRGMPRAARRELVAEHLRLVGLAGHGGKYPHELSGGMRQRVQIARALIIPETRILLMDEPFGSLDAQTKALLQEELGDIWLRSRKAVLFITHDIAEAVILGDRVGVMTGGPGATIKEIVSVGLERPRRRSSAALGELYEHIWDSLSGAVGTGGDAVHGSVAG
jgi:NitT/TauT family transport system ATP-binding protein